MSVLPLWCLSWAVFEEKCIFEAYTPTHIYFLFTVSCCFFIDCKKRLWGDLCFVKMDLNKNKIQWCVFNLASLCLPVNELFKGKGKWYMYIGKHLPNVGQHVTRVHQWAAVPSLNVSGCQSIGKKNSKTKQLKMRSKSQKDLFSQCFCPETDQSYARTALSVLSLIVLDVFIRGTLRIDRRTHADLSRHILYATWKKWTSATALTQLKEAT